MMGQTQSTTNNNNLQTQPLLGNGTTTTPPPMSNAGSGVNNNSNDNNNVDDDDDLFDDAGDIETSSTFHVFDIDNLNNISINNTVKTQDVIMGGSSLTSIDCASNIKTQTNAKLDKFLFGDLSSSSNAIKAGDTWNEIENPILIEGKKIDRVGTDEYKIALTYAILQYTHDTYSKYTTNLTVNFYVDDENIHTLPILFEFYTNNPVFMPTGVTLQLHYYHQTKNEEDIIVKKLVTYGNPIAGTGNPHKNYRDVALMMAQRNYKNVPDANQIASLNQMVNGTRTIHLIDLQNGSSKIALPLAQEQANDKAISPLSEGNLILRLYQVLHHTMFLGNNHELQLDLRGDKKTSGKNLTNDEIILFFKTHPSMIPSNITLYIRDQNEKHYIQGTGIYNQNNENTINSIKNNPLLFCKDTQKMSPFTYAKYDNTYYYLFLTLTVLLALAMIGTSIAIGVVEVNNMNSVLVDGIGDFARDKMGDQHALQYASPGALTLCAAYTGKQTYNGHEAAKAENTAEEALRTTLTPQP